MPKPKIEQITERGKKKLDAWYRLHTGKREDEHKTSGLKKVSGEYASGKNVTTEND